MAFALSHSLQEQSQTSILHILVTERIQTTADTEGVVIHYLDDLKEDEISVQLFEKYAFDNASKLRWVFKPILLKHLLKQDIEEIVYIDPDIFFFHPFSFLFEELKKFRILLTPHWRCSNPFIDSRNFEKNFREGLFNAGFVGVNKDSPEILDWWANACLHECTKDFKRGMYVDQKYLDFIPVFFSGVKILEHRGCNVAEWNRTECQRTPNEKKEVLINHKWPIVFIHFTNQTIRNIVEGDDTVLREHFEKFSTTLKKYGWKKDLVPPKPAPPTQIQPATLRQRVRGILGRTMKRLSLR